MKEIDLTLIPHCDIQNCGFGSVQLYCPECNELITDYDELWWNFSGEGFQGFKDEGKCCCEKCNTHFIVKQINNKYYIKKYETEI